MNANGQNSPSGSAESAPEGNKAANQGVDLEGDVGDVPEEGVQRQKAQEDAEAEAAEASTSAEATTDAELYADSITAAEALKTSDTPKIPTHININPEVIKALKSEGIENAEQLKAFFEEMPTVEEVKEDNPDKDISKMNLVDWVKFLKELKAAEEEGSSDAEEAGFLAGLGGAFGKIGAMFKEFFGKIKNWLTKLFAGKDKVEDKEVTAKMEDLVGKFAETKKSLASDGYILEDMALGELETRILFGLGVDSPQTLDSFFRSQPKVEDVIQQAPDRADDIRGMSLDEYFSFLMDEFEETEPEGQEPQSEVDQLQENEGEEEQESQSEEQPDKYFSRHPRQDIDLERGGACPFKLITGETVVFMLNEIVIDGIIYNVKTLGVVGVAVNKIETTKDGYHFYLSAGTIDGDFDLDFAKTEMFIKGLSDLAKASRESSKKRDQKGFTYKIPEAFAADSKVKQFAFQKVA